MQPIATPEETIDSTIGSSGAVAGGQIERAVLERVRLASHDLLERIPIVLRRREGDVAVDAIESVELLPVGDDLVRLAAGILDRLSDRPRRVVGELDPPQYR